MKGKKIFSVFILGLLLFVSCRKENLQDREYKYYEVGFHRTDADWRDTAFVVRTRNTQLIQQIEAQLSMPINKRKLVVGKLVAGSGGYNKNASHEFKWRFEEDDWQLADVTVEIYDGKPFTDVDQNLSYWLNTVKRFGSWSSYIKRRLTDKP